MSEEIFDSLVGDICISVDEYATVQRETEVGGAIEILQRSRPGIICVLEQDRLCGVITDGDVRRAVSRSGTLLPAFFSLTCSDVMSTDCVICSPLDSVKAVSQLMIEKKVYDIPVINPNSAVVGIVNVHQLLRMRV